MQEITSYFHGYDVDQLTLLDRITRMGWKVDKIESKPEGYIAKLKNEQGATVEKVGNTVETALALALTHLIQIHTRHRQSAMQKTWNHMLPEIAKAYAKAPVFDYKAAPSWKALADDDYLRAEKLKKQLAVEYTHEPVPYAENHDMAKDISKGKIKIPLTDIRHPIWTPQQHLDHRLAHAVLGSAPAGGVSNWVGTNQAFAHHSQWLSDLAQEALFTEHIGHKAYQTHYSSSGPKKIAHLGFLKSKDVGDDMEDGESIEETRAPWVPKEASMNTNWKSGIEPPYPNAFLDSDPLDYMGLREDAKKTNRNWHKWEKVIEDERA